MRLVHQEPSRGETYRAMAPAEAEPRGEFIAVVDPQLIAEIFSSASFRVLDAAGDYRYIGDRTGLDFSPIITALDHVPLVKEGDLHRQLRADMARLLGARSRQAEARLRADAAEFLPPLLAEGRTVDLVSEIVIPAYRSLFSALLGFDPTGITAHPTEDLSQVFDRLLSLNRRKRLCESMRAAFSKVSDQAESLEATAGLAVALTMLGQDALVGSLATSLWYELSINAGKRLNQIDFGAMGSTGVPHIERIAIEDTAVGPLRFEKGQMVRLYLDATTRETCGEDAGLTFGKGRHLCLGKPLALAAWRVLTETLKGSDLRTRLLDIQFRRGDYVFNYPDHARISFERA